MLKILSPKLCMFFKKIIQIINKNNNFKKIRCEECLCLFTLDKDVICLVVSIVS